MTDKIIMLSITFVDFFITDDETTNHDETNNAAIHEQPGNQQELGPNAAHLPNLKPPGARPKIPTKQYMKSDS